MCRVANHLAAQAQEQDAMSDDDFESDEDEEETARDGSPSQRPTKKQNAV